MKFFQAGRLKIMLGQVIWITITWTIIGALDALNTHAMAVSNIFSPTSTYNFQRYFFINVIAAFLSGLVSGSILIFYLRRLFRTSAFGFSLLITSLILSAISFGISILAFGIYINIVEGQALFSPSGVEQSSLLSKSIPYVKRLGFWSVISMLTVIFLNIREKYGIGVFSKLLLGRYHRPREEERIFMFVDMKSATTIAEKLGHQRFFNLLNDFFADITDAILYTNGEIYQYIGDEIIISWDMKNGLAHSNCIRCFCNMQDAIQKRSLKYLDKYGLVPEFKAGLHCGLVTVGEIGVIKKDIVYSGDVMNTTSRIENMCNHFKVELLLSKSLLDKLQIPPNDTNIHRAGSILLKGKKQKIELYSFGASPQNVEWQTIANR